MQVNVSATLASSTEIAAGTFAFDRIVSPGRLVAPRFGRVTDSCWGSYWISVDFDVVVTTLVCVLKWSTTSLKPIGNPSDGSVWVCYTLKQTLK